MNKISNTFFMGLRYIFTPVNHIDIENERKILLLNITCFLTWLFLTPFMFIAFGEGKYLLSLLELIILILMVVLYFYIRHTSDTLTPSYLTTGFLGVLFLYLIVDGGIAGTGPLWAFPFPILMFFLHGTKRGTIGMTLFFTVLLLVFFLPHTPLLMTSYPINFKIRYITCLLVVFFLSYFSERIRANTQERITAKVDELAETLASLKAAEEERNHLQDELLSTRKIEAIGTLAGGMAHEFNNQVSVIIGNTELLQHQLNNSPAMEKKLTTIHNASLRIASLTDQLLSFSRKQILKMERVHLQTLVKRARYTIDGELGDQIDLVIEADPEAFPVQADPIQIIQVIIDLVLNARDAMVGQKIRKLTISIKNTIFNQENIRKGPFVCLTVQDTGIGMDAQTLNKIYDPFFTTKKAGQGTGLGLSFVYGTIQQHDGWMNVTSQPGMGTTVQIYLPGKKD